MQDRWFRDVNEATIRVLARNGWRVLVPRASGLLRRAARRTTDGSDTARRLARRNAAAFAGADHVVVNAAGCGAHMQDYGDLVDGLELPVRRPDGVPARARD